MARQKNQTTKRKPLSKHAAQVRASLLADDPATFSTYGEYALSGSLMARMEEIVYTHGYEAGRLLSVGNSLRAKRIKQQIETEFWELAEHENIVDLLEAAWADGLEAGSEAQKNPATRTKTICSWCKHVIYDGPLDTSGLVSHGICYACAVEHAEDYGLTDEDLEEIREEQGVNKP